MDLIKIDPQTRTVERIDNEGTLDALRAVIGCRMIDVCARQDSGDSLTVDDEALYQEPQPAAFTFGNSNPIHGIAILTGVDDEGGTDVPWMTLKEAESMVQWLGEINTAPYLHVFAFPNEN